MEFRKVELLQKTVIWKGNCNRQWNAGRGLPEPTVFRKDDSHSQRNAGMVIVTDNVNQERGLSKRTERMNVNCYSKGRSVMEIATDNVILEGKLLQSTAMFLCRNTIQSALSNLSVRPLPTTSTAAANLQTALSSMPILPELQQFTAMQMFPTAYSLQQLSTTVLTKMSS